MTPLLGFSPDLPASTPGVLVNCVNFIPYESGMKSAPSPIALDAAAVLPSPVQGCAVLEKLNGQRRLFAGTQTKLYELSGVAFNDISRALPYIGSLDGRWSFSNFGDAFLAANGFDKIQRSTTGVFSDIADAPAAKIIFAVGYYIVALNTPSQPNGWACCDKFNDQVWTSSLSNLADSGELLATPGAITAGAKLGDLAVAYKARGIYVGNFVESQTQTIDWRQIPAGFAGCVGQDAITFIDDLHFFVGPDNFWIFDGSRPVPVGNLQVRQWFFENVAPDYLYKTQCVYDRQNNNVYVSYVGTDSTVVNKSLVYNTVSKQWGRFDFAIQSIFNYTRLPLTIDQLDTLSATINGLPAIPLDSQYWLNGSKAIAYFDGSNKMQISIGQSISSSFTTCDFGDDQSVSTLSRLRLRYAAGKNPVSATAKSFYKFGSGDSYLLGSSGLVNDGKFDARQSGRWHNAAFIFNGDCKVEQVSAEVKQSGQR
jgi:hypothetical protein